MCGRGRDGGGRIGAQRAFQQVQRAVEYRVVATVLNQSARMCHGRSVAREDKSDLSERQPPGDMRQLHRHLSSKGYSRTPARP